MSRLDEKRFEALGQEWIARFDFNATCAIEEETGKGFYEFVSPLMFQLDKEDVGDPGKVFAAIKGLRQSDIRIVMFHALSDAHDITIEQTGKIIQDLGTAGAMEVVAWAIQRAIAPEADGEAEGNVKATSQPNRKARKTAASGG